MTITDVDDFSEIKDKSFEESDLDLDLEETEKPKKPRKTRSDKGQKRGSPKTQVADSFVLSSETETIKLTLSIFINYISTREGMEKWKATDEELEGMAKVSTNLINKYLPMIEKYKEEFEFICVVGGYIGVRLMVK